jgi:hypothetical protein
MTGNRRTAEDVRYLLQARIESLVETLLPDGRRLGPFWMARNPTRGDTNAGSFWVRVHGVAPGTWADEATGDGAAQVRNGAHKGDVLGLIGYIKGLPFKEAMAWAREWLGIEKLSDETVRTARAKAGAAQNVDGQRQANILAQNRKRAFAAWLNASPKLIGTPVETYLATRGIDLGAFGREVGQKIILRPPGALRFAMRTHLETNTKLPCMLALMTGPPVSGAGDSPAGSGPPAQLPESVPYAIHCTFLKIDGSGKANVTPARKMWPSYAGSSIRLSMGYSGMRPSEAAKHGILDQLVLCEGVEDGLSIALACPHLRVWAVGALGNLGKVTVPSCVDEVIVAADNDWGKPQAAKLLDASVNSLVAQNVTVSIARSHIGKDANAALLGGDGEKYYRHGANREPVA